MTEPREFTLAGVELKGRVFDFDEVKPWEKPRIFDPTKVKVWKPPEEKKRRVFSLEEAKEAEAKRLIDVQEKVLYQFSPKEIKDRMNTYHPKNWKADYQYTMNQHWKEKYGYGIEEIFSKDFWKKTYAINFPKAVAMTYEMSYGFKKRWGKRGEQALLKYGSEVTPYGKAVGAAINAGEGDPLEAGAMEVVRTTWDMFVYAPVTAWKLYKNPYKTIQEDILDVAALIALVAGVKVAKGVMGKVTKAQKMGKPVFMSDVLDPLKGTPHLAQKFKNQLKSFPDVMVEAVPEPLELVKPMAKGQAPIFRHQIQRIIKDITTHGDIKDRPMLFGAATKKGFLNIGFRVPLRVFERYKGFRSMLYDKARHGGKLILDEKKQVIIDAKRWKKLGVNRKLQKEVGTIMTGMQKDGMKLLAEMGVEIPELSNLKLGMRYIKWLRNKYDNYLGRINLVRTEAGLKPLNPVEHYATWIRNLHKLSEAGIDIAKTDARTIKHVMASAFKYAKKRKPGAVAEGIELDAGLVYQTYSNAAIEHIRMTPVIAQARALLKPFKMTHKYLKEVKVKGKKPKMVEKTKRITFDMKQKAPRWTAWLSEWSDTIAGIYKAIPKSKVGRYFRALRGLQRNVAVGVLGWNVRSALIQPTALRLSYIMLGENNTMWGFWKNFTSKQSRKFALAESEVLQGRITNYSMDIHVAMAREAGVGKKFARSRQSFAQASMKPLQLLDFETARASWLGAYHLAEKMFGRASKGGKILNRELHRACVRWADDVVTKTQASAAIWDVAPIQRTVWGKFLTMFQTFVINEFDFLTSDLLHYKNPYINMGNVGGNISRLILATGVINYFMEGILKIRSPYPAPVTAYIRGTKEGKTALQMIGSMVKEGAETLPVMGSSFRWSTAWKSTAPAGFQVGFLDPLQMMNRLLNKPTLTTDQAEWLAKVIGVPGASQAAKFHRRMRRGQNYYQALLGVREEAKRKKKKVKKLTTSGW